MTPDFSLEQERIIQQNAREIARLRSLAAELAATLKRQRTLWELVDGDLRTPDAHGFRVSFMDLHQPIQHIDTVLARARAEGITTEDEHAQRRCN